MEETLGLFDNKKKTEHSATGRAYIEVLVSHGESLFLKDIDRALIDGRKGHKHSYLEREERSD